MIQFVETASGKRVDFINPNPDDIDIKDIAYSLANQCRFNGHVQFFSVAEHCLSVAARLPRHKQLAGLLHDASEAYLSDIPSPVKAHLSEYKAIEDNLLAVIAKKFGVEFDEEVKWADNQATWNEAFYLMPSRGSGWIPAIFVPDESMTPLCLPPVEACRVFYNAFMDITNSTKAVVA